MLLKISTYRNIMLCLLALISSVSLCLPVSQPLVAFNSAKGSTYLTESKYKKDFYPLISHFVTQRNLSFCAPASIAMTLNAMSIKRPIARVYYPFRLFTQQNLFSARALQVYPMAYVNFRGMSLDLAGKLINVHQFVKATVYHANQVNKASFLNTAQQALHSGHAFIIVNIFRKAMHEEGGGHFSPLGAYDQKSDRFLLLDVARYKYPPVWVKTSDLWNAMHTKDGKYFRGFIVLSKKD